MRAVHSRLAQALQRQIKDKFYGDRAVLLATVGTGTYDEYNHEVVTTTSIPIDCSFTDTLFVRDLEAWKDYVDVEAVNAQLRYAGVAPQKGWHVKLVSRFDGTPYRDEREYEIVAIQNRADFGYVLALKAVTV